MQAAWRACTKLTHALLHRFRVHFPERNHDSVQMEQRTEEEKKTVNFFTLSLECPNFDFYSIVRVSCFFFSPVLNAIHAVYNFYNQKLTMFTSILSVAFWFWWYIMRIFLKQQLFIDLYLYFFDFFHTIHNEWWIGCVTFVLLLFLETRW